MAIGNDFAISPTFRKRSWSRGWIATQLASAEVGDADHLKVFANEEAAERWFRENDASR
jgi:hypothetical protein